MNKRVYGIKCLLVALSLAGIYVSIVINSVSAQHTDVFNIDFEKKKKKKEKKNVGYIEVEEKIIYKIAIEKEKLDNNDFSVYDLEMIEIPEEDSTKFAWHQIACTLEKSITQEQIRSAGDLECDRSRKGTLYWLADGKKHVHWGAWTFWKCIKGDDDDDNDDDND